MNNLKLIWHESEKIKVESAIKDLFRCHGTKASENWLSETANLFATELSERSIPYQAILTALHELKFEDVNKISLHLIEQQAKKHVVHEEEQRSHCDWCDGRGVVMLRNKDKYQFSFACKCSNGDRFAAQGNKRWNGEQFQEGKQGLYEIEHYDLTLKTISRPI